VGGAAAAAWPRGGGLATREPLTEGGRVFQETRGPERGSFGSSAAWPALLRFIGLGLLAGAADAAATAPALHGWYLSLARPAATPPAWLLPLVWTALAVPVGTAAWLAWRHPGHRRALRLWGWQLLLSALWPPSFFLLHVQALALALIAGLLVLITLTWLAFARVSAMAGLLLFPSLLWTCYAAYLNAGFWLLNPA
jgi:tryptophan-rich sensory protein